MKGFYGRILEVDVSARTFIVTTTDDAVLRDTLGGKGLASALLLEHNPPGVDPLSPDNRIIFATGPVAGSLVWGGSRYGVFTKSPLTGAYLESYCGGKVPEAVDSAGYDAIVISGASDTPVALVIHPDGCEFVDAGDIWSMETFGAEDAVNVLARAHVPDRKKYGAAVIGPAGENLVRFACIESDYWRSAGRGGAGAVLGSKKIKGVAFCGSSKREYADPKGLAAYAKRFLKDCKDTPGTKAYKARGTTQMVAIMNTVGAFPARYWEQGTCDHWERLSGDTYHEEHEITPRACAKCFMACGRMATISGGRRSGLKIEGPEYETIYAFGGLCMIEDMAEVAHLNDLCDRLGVDTITAGNLCGFAIEAVRRGAVDYPIAYNDPDGCERLIRDIVDGSGLGRIMSQGIVAASRELGLEDLAVHVKGMEPAGYDPRVLKGMGLSYAVSDRGACHLRTTFYKPELAGMIPPDTIEGKAEMLLDFEDRLTLFDTLILCRFFRDFYTWDEFEELIPLLTGMQGDVEALRKIAANIAGITRRFNLREGVGPETDRLPTRILKQALPSGHALTEEEMAFMLADYYRLRGWNTDGTLA